MSKQDNRKHQPVKMSHGEGEKWRTQTSLFLLLIRVCYLHCCLLTRQRTCIAAWKETAAVGKRRKKVISTFLSETVPAQNTMIKRGIAMITAVLLFFLYHRVQPYQHLQYTMGGVSRSHETCVLELGHRNFIFRAHT